MPTTQRKKSETIAKKKTQQDTPNSHAHARQLDQNCLAREKMGGGEGGRLTRLLPAPWISKES